MDTCISMKYIASRFSHSLASSGATKNKTDYVPARLYKLFLTVHAFSGICYPFKDQNPFPQSFTNNKTHYCGVFACFCFHRLSTLILEGVSQSRISQLANISGSSVQLIVLKTKPLWHLLTLYWVFPSASRGHGIDTAQRYAWIYV